MKNKDIIRLVCDLQSNLFNLACEQKDGTQANLAFLHLHAQASEIRRELEKVVCSPNSPENSNCSSVKSSDVKLASPNTGTTQDMVTAKSQKYNTAPDAMMNEKLSPLPFLKDGLYTVGFELNVVKIMVKNGKWINADAVKICNNFEQNSNECEMTWLKMSEVKVNNTHNHAVRIINPIREMAPPASPVFFSDTLKCWKWSKIDVPVCNPEEYEVLVEETEIVLDEPLVSKWLPMKGPVPPNGKYPTRVYGKEFKGQFATAKNGKWHYYANGSCWEYLSPGSKP